MLTRIYSPTKREDGFTLIELLVVIIIIGVLAAVAIPLFLDQRKLAADAAVKSDVRNTATQVQTWQINNPGIVAPDTTAYTTAGGKVVATGSNSVGVSVASDGSYIVCGYVGNGKQYTASSAAYVFDSSTGRFGTGSCSGGIVGGGSSSTPAPSTSAPTGTPTTTPAAAPTITRTTLPDGQMGTAYSQTIAISGTVTDYSVTGLPAGLGATYSASTGILTIAGTPTEASDNFAPVITASNSGSSDTYNAALKVSYRVAYNFDDQVTSPFRAYTSNVSLVSWSHVFHSSGQYSMNIQANAGQYRAHAPLTGLTVGKTYRVSANYYVGSKFITNPVVQVIKTETSTTPDGGWTVATPVYGTADADGYNGSPSTPLTFTFVATATTEYLNLGASNSDSAAVHSVWYDDIVITG